MKLIEPLEGRSDPFRGQQTTRTLNRTCWLFIDMNYASRKYRIAGKQC